MNKILGIPRNAAIALLAVIISAGSLTVALVIPWSGRPDGRSEPSRSPPPSDIAATTTSPRTLPALASAPAKDPRRPEATRVSINFDFLAGDGALAAFLNAVDLSGPPLTRSGADRDLLVSMHYRDVPILEALLDYCRQARVIPNEWSREQIVFRSNPEPSLGRWCVSGPFAVIVQKIESSAILSLNSDKSRGRSNQVFFSMLAEPTVRLVHFANPTFDEFRDDKDQALGQSRIELTMPVSRRLQQAHFSFGVTLPASPGKKIASLRGAVTALVAIRSETLQTSAPEESLTKTYNGLTIEMLPLKPQEGTVPQFTTQIRITRNQADDATWNRMISHIEPVAFSANDERLNLLSSGSRPDAAGSLLFTFSVRANPNVGQPHHLQLELPVEFAEIRVPFEFKDLPLP